MSRFILLNGTVLVLSLGAAAAGQEKTPPAPADDPSQKATLRYQEEVEVAAELPATPPPDMTALKSPLPVASTPASISVVPRTLFEVQRALVMGDALRNASGVNVGSGFGVFDFFVIRGFDSLSSGLVLIDGAPEPEATFYPLYNLRQVEVLKGPGAYLYGGGPLAGTVQLVRKQPFAGKFGDVSFSYGSFQTYQAEADANVARADGTLALRLNGVYEASQGYRDDKDSSLLAVNPGVVWSPNARTRVAVNFEYARPRFAPDVGLPLLGSSLPPVPRTRSYQSPFDASDQDVYRVRLDVVRQVGPRLTLRDKFYYTELDWSSDGTLFAGAFPGPDGGIAVVRSLVLLDDRQKLLGNQLEAQVTFATGSVRHRLLGGVEVSRLGDQYTQDVAALPSIGLLAPQETAELPLFVIPGLSQAGDTRSRVVAPYVVDHVTFSPRFQVFAGGRLDVTDFEDEVTGTSREATKFNPLLGVVFSPAPGLSLYANAGAAFAPPSSQVVGERLPEESRQIELGVKQTLFHGKGLATLAFYYLDKQNIAIPDATGFTRQNGDQSSRGIELELSAEARKGWFTYLSYAFNDSELTRFAERVLVGFDAFAVVDRSGNTPAFAPRNILNFWTTKEFGNGVSVGAGVRYVSSQFIAEDNAFAIDGYLVLDATAAVKHGRWRWSVNLQNVTGHDYETRGFSSTSVLPADAFAAYGKVEVALGAR